MTPDICYDTLDIVHINDVMHALFSSGRLDYYYYHTYIYMQLLEIHLNGHNLVSFEATISSFFMVIDLNDTYRIMMTLMMKMMMMIMIKIQNGQN